MSSQQDQQDATTDSTPADAIAGSCPTCFDAGSGPEAEAIADALAEGHVDRNPVQATDAESSDATVDASIFQRCVTYCESLPDANASTCNRICAGPPHP
jgi:hypothetical protein